MIDLLLGILVIFTILNISVINIFVCMLMCVYNGFLYLLNNFLKVELLSKG